MKPQQLAQLKHDRILTKANFPTFVETFNYTVNRSENLKGDADIRPQDGFIKVDNTDPEHPVIRLTNIDQLGKGGSGGKGTAVAFPEPWMIDVANNEIKYPYFQIGTYRAEADTSNVDLSTVTDLSSTKTIWCNIDIANLSAEASYERNSDWNHFPVEVFMLSALSAGTGQYDPETHEEISALTIETFYKCRYPNAPVWELYSI